MTPEIERAGLTQEEYVKAELQTLTISHNDEDMLFAERYEGRVEIMTAAVIAAFLRRTVPFRRKSEAGKKYKEDMAKLEDISKADRIASGAIAGRIYRKYMGYGRTREVDYTIKGKGRDPNAFLEDGSHRAGLGYIR